RMADFFKPAVTPAIASLLAAAAALALKDLLSLKHDLPTLAGCAAAFVLAYLAVFCILPGGRAELREFLSYALMVLGRRKASGAAGAPAFEGSAKNG
ncbi:MAG: hypothetical protein KGR98_15440, partial [Verrucomicrobia bacterium]|nr:hypothetical protein [Verrucomicrobiota bacterium]